MKLGPSSLVMLSLLSSACRASFSLALWVYSVLLLLPLRRSRKPKDERGKVTVPKNLVVDLLSGPRLSGSNQQTNVSLSSLSLQSKPHQTLFRILKPTLINFLLRALSVMYVLAIFDSNHTLIRPQPISSLHPFGTLVEELGPIGDIEVETSALLKDCNFPTEEFSDNVLKCIPPVPWT